MNSQILPPVAFPTAAARGTATVRDIAALAIVMILPSLMTWLEFMLVPGDGSQGNAAAQGLFRAGKAAQFVFPLVFVLLVDPRSFVPSWPARRYLVLGLGMGLIVGVGALGLYFLWLRDTGMFDTTAATFVGNLKQWGLDTPSRFWVTAIVFSTVHSLLEECAWRWFALRWLKRYMSFGWALAVSSVGFMAHHVVILSIYLPGYFWLGVVPFSLCVALGGVLWGWLYDRGNSLIPVWLSHALVDLALMLVGWDLALQYWAKASG